MLLDSLSIPIPIFGTFLLGACGCAAWWGTDETQKYYQSHCHTVAGPLIDKADELPVHNRKGVGNLQNIRKEKGRGGGKECLRLCRRGTDHSVTVAGPLILHFRKLQCAIRNARTRFNRSLLVPYPYLSQKSQMFCFHNKCLN